MISFRSPWSRSRLDTGGIHRDRCRLCGPCLGFAAHVVLDVPRGDPPWLHRLQYSTIYDHGSRETCNGRENRTVVVGRSVFVNNPNLTPT